MGLPAFFAVEYFAADLKTYALHSNDDQDNMAEIP
jgi:hypothetical protein